MVFQRPTRAAAIACAAELRRSLRGTDWTVTITAPLYPGDQFMIVAA